MLDLKLKILLFLYNEEGRILVIKERSQKRNHTGWNFIKGSFKGGESILDCARREALEEVGVELSYDEIEWIDTKEMISAKKHRIFFLCKGHTKEKVEALGCKDELIEEVKWFDKEDILKMDKKDFLDEFVWELRDLVD